MSLPRMSLHIGDYHKDTGHLTATGHGGYVLLMMHYWATGGLPTDDRQLAIIARMTNAEWKVWGPVLKAFFREGMRHKRIDKEREEAEARYEKRVNAGKKGGDAKARAKQGSSNASPMPCQPITGNQEREGIETQARASGAEVSNISETHSEFLRIARTTIDDPLFFGVFHQIDAMLARGFSRETILAGAARAMQGKINPPSWPYFAKCIETENTERSAPAKQEFAREKSAPHGSITAALDEHIKRLRSIEENENRGDGEAPPRLLSHG